MSELTTCFATSGICFNDGARGNRMNIGEVLGPKAVEVIRGVHTTRLLTDPDDLYIDSILGLDLPGVCGEYLADVFDLPIEGDGARET